MKKERLKVSLCDSRGLRTYIDSQRFTGILIQIGACIKRHLGVPFSSKKNDHRVVVILFFVIPAGLTPTLYINNLRENVLLRGRGNTCLYFHSKHSVSIGIALPHIHITNLVSC